ncbi:MAG: RlpA-like double-psi beta-barrel domain-containing protein [Micromonosporaceae bacterium]
MKGISVANYIGRHVLTYGGYQPRHAAPRSLGRGFTGQLVAAVAVLVVGLVIGGSGVALRLGPQRPVATGAGSAVIAPDDLLLDDLGSGATSPDGSLVFGPDTVPAQRPDPAPAAVSSRSGAVCVASWFGGSRIASDIAVSSTASAYRVLAVGSHVRVTNVTNGLSTVVQIAGRAQSAAGRCLNLSVGAFTAIADPQGGLVNVRYEVLA